MEGARRKRQYVQCCAVPQNLCCTRDMRIALYTPSGSSPLDHGMGRAGSGAPARAGTRCCRSSGVCALRVSQRRGPRRRPQAGGPGTKGREARYPTGRHVPRPADRRTARRVAYLPPPARGAGPDRPRRGRDSCHSLPAGGRILRAGGGRRRSCGAGSRTRPAPSRGRGRCSRSRPRTRRASGPSSRALHGSTGWRLSSTPAPYRAADRDAARRALAASAAAGPCPPVAAGGRTHAPRRRARFLAPIGPLARPHRRPALAAPRGRRGRGPHAGGGGAGAARAGPCGLRRCLGRRNAAGGLRGLRPLYLAGIS